MKTETPADNAKDAPKGAWRLLALVLAAFVGLDLATLLLPHDPYVRYQQLEDTLHFRSVWAYERMTFDDTPIDIAFIGNSRLAAAISAPTVEDQLRKRLGREVQVANLSLPQEGRNAHYAIVKQLLEHKPEVKLIVLSAIEQMPRVSHPAFSSIAEAGDLVTMPLLVNRDYPSDIAAIPYRQMSLFVQSLAPETFGNHAFDEEKYAGSDLDTTLSFRSLTNWIDRDTIYSAPELRGPARRHVASIAPPILPASLTPFEFAVEYHYTQAIAQLAREHGVQIAFAYLPVFENPEPMRQADLYAQFGPILSATCMANHAEFYSDYGHFNRFGARQVSQEISDILARANITTTLQSAQLSC